MKRAFYSELLKLRRRSVVLWSGGSIAGAILLFTLSIFLTATKNGGNDAVLFSDLATSHGAIEGFNSAILVLGPVLFILFVSTVSSEFSRGTIRMLLTLQPRRDHLLLGKALAVIVFAGFLLAAGELFSIATAIVIAASRNIPIHAWFGFSGVGRVFSSFALALLSAAGYGSLGLAIGVLTRSMVAGTSIGLGWFLVVEHVILRFWHSANHWLPGLVFTSLLLPNGNSYNPALRDVIVAALYVAAGLALAVTQFAQQDVNA